MLKTIYLCLFSNVKIKLQCSIWILLMTVSTVFSNNTPLKMGVVGLSHSHVHWILSNENQSNFEIIGIVEPNTDLASRYSKQYNFSLKLVYNTLDEMLESVQPEAVTAFGSIYKHLEIVQKCAPKGIHVMVEKPLAVSLSHAQQMQTLAKKHNIHVLTNYETSWYPTNHKAYDLVKNKAIGDMTKIIVRDGHKGPKKIGVNKEFLDWLTDPMLNGGGAIMDFGCYGANLVTWLMNGEKPISVTAVTQQLQMENNPKVDDEAIIILNYKHSNAIIQASWNWPIGRKDMEIYGLKGAIYADDGHNLRLRISEGYSGYDEQSFKLDNLKSPYHDPFAWFMAVIRDEISIPPYGLGSLENNMIVMEILDAAVKSAKMKKTISIESP